VSRSEVRTICRRAGRVLAVASIYRNLENLKAELAMEQAVGR
jgi:hypothetical protein